MVAVLLPEYFTIDKRRNLFALIIIVHASRTLGSGVQRIQRIRREAFGAEENYFRSGSCTSIFETAAPISKRFTVKRFRRHPPG